MKVSAKQAFVAFFALICTLGALWAGQKLYRQQAVTSPLVTTVEHLQGVKKATIHDGTVTVELHPNADLMTSYRAVQACSSAALGHAPKTIEVVSTPDGKLKTLASNMAFVVAQGKATGQYVAMQKSLLAMAHDAAAGVDIEMGDHHLYLTLHHGSHVLYEVIGLELGGGKA